MQWLWTGLANNAVCMLILLPMFGAVLVQAARPFGCETVRRTALTNVLLSMFLLIVVVANFEVATPIADPTNVSAAPLQPRAQLQTDLRWMGGHNSAATPNIRFAVGVDGISLWQIAFVVLLMFAAVMADSQHEVAEAAKSYSAILLMQSALVGAFAALDVILFCVFLEFSMWPLAVMLGRNSDSKNLTSVRRLCVWNTISSLLVFAGLVVMVLAFSWMRATETNLNPPLVFSISDLTMGIIAWSADDLALQNWNEVKGWVFLLLISGFAIKAATVPFHGCLLASDERPSIPVRVMRIAATLAVAVYGIVRFIVPVFPEIVTSMAHSLSMIVLVTIVFVALSTVACRDLGRLMSQALVLHSALCLLAVASLNPVGVTGALLHSSAIILSAGAVYFLIDRFPRTAMWRRGLLLLAVGAVVGIPATSGFAGQTMIVIGVFQADPIFAAWTCLALILMLWAFARTMFGGETISVVAEDENHGVVESRVSARRTLIAVLPLFGVICWIGVNPQFFVSRMNLSVEHSMIRYQSVSHVGTPSVRKLSQKGKM